jgi:hypothetical protein
MFQFNLTLLPSNSVFCCRKYVDRSWEYINRSQTHECGNGDWAVQFPEKEYVIGIFVAVQVAQTMLAWIWQTRMKIFSLENRRMHQNDDNWWAFFLLFILCFDPLTFRNSAVAPALGEMKFLPLSLSLTGWKEVHMYVDLHQNCE